MSSLFYCFYCIKKILESGDECTNTKIAINTILYFITLLSQSLFKFDLFMIIYETDVTI